MSPEIRLNRRLIARLPDETGIYMTEVGKIAIEMPAQKNAGVIVVDFSEANEEIRKKFRIRKGIKDVGFSYKRSVGIGNHFERGSQLLGKGEIMVVQTLTGVAKQQQYYARRRR